MFVAASKRALARFLVVTAAIAAVSCGSDDADPAFVVGAGDSIESTVLAEVYAGALARTGLRVTVLTGLGQRADYLTALDQGRIALVGEHGGELLTHLDATSTARTPAQVTESLSRALPPGLLVADPAEWTDMRPRVLLAADTSTRERVHTVTDLTPHCSTWQATEAPVPDVLPGAAAKIAGCGFAGGRPTPDPAILRNSLLAGEFQVGILSGPPTLAPGADAGLTVLADDDYAVPAQNVVPLFRRGLLDDQRVKKLNYVAGELTTDDLVDMILRVRSGATPAEAARLWLDAHAL
ncbi:glycine betaine ABC transporter substrate-binding protein [Nocardia bovistercoris]|uniref:Transporter n=1 Tax=Nocardia bovistercoris TaxID=2785916 RepID=A0A931MZ84_9NOCA|nr:glycine betaine ABC transporter substrate-binding protein [Nocardia bovistercoris]MBH0775865.1 transporter [Nocardia bovistercoris]